LAIIENCNLFSEYGNSVFTLIAYHWTAIVIVVSTMTAISWISFGALCTKVLAVSNSAPEMLDYTALAISVCTSCAAIIALSNMTCQPFQGWKEELWKEAAALRSMASETPFAESRRQLMALADRMEKDEAFVRRYSTPITKTNRQPPAA
jgi:hypothetical protein